MSERADFLRFLADQVQTLPPGRRLVAIDGVDGSGKTVLASELAAVLRERSRRVVEVHVDAFHHLRDRRYQRGRTSAEGFWLDSYDYEALERDALGPLKAGGSGLYRWGATDLERDVRLELEPIRAPADAVVLVEGIFLHRDELQHWWDYSLWLDVPFEESARRMILRDGFSEDADDAKVQRYLDGQRLYFNACKPWLRASMAVDNSDWSAPRIVPPVQADSGSMNSRRLPKGSVA